MNELDKKLISTVNQYIASGIEQQVDYEKFYLYSIITHSTAIEGSTVTEVENQLLFDEGISPAGRSMTEQLMNLDLKDAYSKWLKQFKTIQQVTVDQLCQMSASVMRRTGSEYNTMAGTFDSSKGELRLLGVRAGMSGRSYMAYQKVPAKLAEFCKWLNSRLAELNADDVASIYRLSFAAHYRLVTIHPWVDGNGRTTRLLMNCLQYRHGLPMSKILNKNKAYYIQALIDAREEDDENIFIERALKMLVDDLEKELTIFSEDSNVTDNVTEKGSNVTDNVTEKDSIVTDNVTETQRRILEIIQHVPAISQSKIAELLGIHRVNVNRNMQSLVKSGMIVRVGSDRKGYWKILK